jgi:hypothetical protein
MIHSHTEERPLVILDADVHFWKSCEDWKFNALMAGYYCPEMMNDWAQCRSVPRLHTSFLWFSDVPRLRQMLRWDDYPNDAYTPSDLFMPSVKYLNGERIFWDTCAGLYNMIGGAHFTQEHTDCYEHLNSAGFVEEMVKRMGGKTGEDFKTFHALAPADMKFVKTFCWPLVAKYYRRKSVEAQVMKCPFRDPVDRCRLPG